MGTAANGNAHVGTVANGNAHVGARTKLDAAIGEAEALKKLHEIAGRKDAKDPLDRLAALYLFATAYGKITDGTRDLAFAGNGFAELSALKVSAK